MRRAECALRFAYQVDRFEVSLAENTAAAVRLEVSHASRINFALYQNYVPIVQRIAVHNTSSAELRDVRLTIWAEPAIAHETAVTIERIPAGGSFHVDAVDIELVRLRLAEQIERERGVMYVEAATDTGVLAREELAIEVLPWHEWQGDGSLPEILAAFVQRGHPIVAKLLQAASRRLAATTGDASLASYRSRDPGRVRATVAAIFGALSELGLAFVDIDAGFEQVGAPIRTPEQLLDERLASCLDLATLFAACIERAGLNPLLVVREGGVVCGAWLIDECFTNPVVDDAVALGKRLELGYLEFFDPTLVARRSDPDFEEACRLGRRDATNADALLYAIDVCSARNNRIRPIPLRAKLHDLVIADGAEPPAASAELDEVLEVVPPDAATDAGEDKEGRDRTHVWKHRLLDLSLRNRLLNFRATKKTIPLLGRDLGKLEDALSDGRSFSVHVVSKQLDAADPRDADLYRERHGEDVEARILADWLPRNRLHAKLSAEELEKRLVEIYRGARSSFEETGANTLYLALGFLEWYETAVSTQPRRAPILLLPLEITRKNVRSGFRIRLSDDEPRINVTLLKKLETEFAIPVAGLDELPEDEHGIDVERVLNSVREAVLAFDRWRVVAEAWIGTFSFTKFLMFLDLEKRGAQLKRNAVIRHLVEHPGEPFPAEPLERHENLDSVRQPSDTWFPMLADSSQLEAIHAASLGRSFVLQGPPGTGKSQTITNLIAHCLADGKRILFVSEKMAALEVVEKRLTRIGLGPYCLELHSNKAKKKQVLAQLGESLELVARAEPAQYPETAERLAASREELNLYVETLHARREIGFRAFDGIAGAIAARETPKTPLELGAESGVSRDRFEAMTEAVDRLVAAAGEVAPIAGHAFLASRLTEWDRTVATTLSDASRATRQVVDELRLSLDRLGALLGSEVGAASFSQIDAIGHYAEVVASRPSPTRALIEAGNPEALRDRLSTWVSSGRRRDGLRAELFEKYDEAIVRLDVDDLLAQLRLANGTFWPLSWWRARASRKLLQGVARQKLSPLPILIADLERAVELRKLSDELAGHGDEAREVFGEAWRDGEPSWDELDALVQWTIELRRALTLVRRSYGEEPKAHYAIAVEGAERDAAIDSLAAESAAVTKGTADLASRQAGLIELLRLQRERAFGKPNDSAALDRVTTLLDGFDASASALRAFTAYNRAREPMLSLELEPLVAALEEGECDATELRSRFDGSFFEWWTGAVLESEPLLKRFSGIDHAHAIAKFRALDDSYLELTRDVVAARLAARLPKLGASIGASESSEVGILQRQLKLRRRHMPIRKLFREIPNLLPRLKPCMLMSPLSVAQYLDVDLPAFDLVVFDEASQIPVWDAIGAIARGTEVVVVGDSKQLPPTSFFLSGGSEDEAEDVEIVEELESILDECDAAQLPKLDLKWHYRSQHESLIAFSNAHYYGNDLFTFPSAISVHPDMGVGWREVPGGVYDRSRSSTNQAEAEAIVAEVVRRVHAGDARTVGVVTFSQKQQALIEDLLDRARLEDRDVDETLSREVEEPIFVKNLENVQGDERDVILFSVCYGPDARGRVFMNFGPLNKPGGERRLNVAITRARQQVVVYSTLRPEMIDLSRVSDGAIGVRHLKAFLEFAQRGPDAISESVLGTESGDRGFENDVQRALEAAGFEIHSRVGFSGYRVDLAVVDPEAEGHYLLGIECDGDVYRSARSARDRDRIRSLVLDRLHWELHRVWSIDWLYERENEIAKLLAAIEDARRVASSRIEVGEELPAATVAPPVVEESARSEPAPVAEATQGPSIYTPVATDTPRGEAEDFYDDRESRSIFDALCEIVDREAPISIDLLQRRIANLWQIKRLTSRVQRRIADVLATLEVNELEDGEQVFVWRPDQDPAHYDDFRVPAEDGSGERESGDLPAQEIAVAATAVLQASISLTHDELVRQTAKLFGIGRVGRRVDSDMSRGIAVLLERGVARADGETLVVVS